MYRIRKVTYDARRFWNLPQTAKQVYLRDYAKLPRKDPDIDLAIEKGIQWLGVAQDKSRSADGGIAAYYSLIDGWSTSYPETTGYAIPTLIKYARENNDENVRNRVVRMLDWLTSIQFTDGSFQGGTIGSSPRQPTIFNTGQILMGLAGGVAEFGVKYESAMCRAADWLVSVQDSDGCWRKHISPFVWPGDKTYHTHVAWGLLEAARLYPDKPYGSAALKNVRWAITQQLPNGWFQNCSLDDPLRPLTHTLAYALRGILEAYRFSGEETFLQAGLLGAESLLNSMDSVGFIAGRFDSDWQATEDWSCLTGTAQIAECWLMLYQDTGISRYRDAAFVANQYVRRRMYVSGAEELVGGVKGAHPIDGAYHAFSYINWACKFMIDSNVLEREVRFMDQGK